MRDTLNDVLLGPYLCRRCIASLVERRSRRSARKTRRIPDLLLIDYVIVHRQGTEACVTAFGDEDLQFWLDDERLLSNCSLCGAGHGYHVFADHGPYPVFISSETCLRQVLEANAPAPAEEKLFELVFLPMGVIAMSVRTGVLGSSSHSLRPIIAGLKLSK